MENSTVRTLLAITGLVFFLPVLSAQEPLQRKWWVEFTDKNNSPFCTCRPASFLSARALERRARAGIAVEENDLPVNPAYVQALKDAGAQLHSTSRWMNAATVIADSASAMRLTQFPFVRKVQYLGPDIPLRNPPNRPAKKRAPVAESPVVRGESSVFGYAGMQNSLLGVPFLYAAGHRGAGIWVAVMDGGFLHADTLPFFDRAAREGRLFQGWDFVEHDSAVYESAVHGMAVLSLMAADLPGYFVGTAPEATYFLIKTEDTGGEFPVEEANWVAGAEWADSIGADMINASLGYTVFNDSTLNYPYADLNGHSRIGSRGAAIAASKGMIVCNSAGNSGDDPWPWIGVPADAPGVIAVGAVRADEKRASFSSTGPSADGRIKPDLVAPGEMIVVAGENGTDLSLSSGTSLAAPMLTGAIASLWSAFPKRPAAEILDAVFQSADQAANPDVLRGYGLPDLARAWLSLGGYLHGNAFNNAGPGLFAFDRMAGTFSFLLFMPSSEPVAEAELFNALGERIPVGPVEWHSESVSALIVSQMQALPPGFYSMRIRTRSGAFWLAGLAWR